MEEKYIYKNLTPFKWFILENFPFIEADFDALTNWQLFCKLGKEINKIIDSQNNVGQEMETISNEFISLYNYVDNYFKNLDVQDEIDNKLDEMVEDGTLQNILSNYANITRIYETTTEMIEDATNLVVGQKVKTLGYYNIDDLGGAYFIITDEIDSSRIQLTVATGLYATFITNEKEINVNQYGLKSNDGSFDNASSLISLISEANTKGYNIRFCAGTYNFNNTVTVNDYLKAMKIKGAGIYYTGDNTTNSGTLLVYNGINWLFNFTSSLWGCEISDFTIECTNLNGGSCIQTQGSVYKSYFERIQTKNSKNGFLIKYFAYVYLRDISVNCTDENYLPGVGIQLGYDTATTEYAFLDNIICQFRNQLGTCLLIKRGIHFSIKNCDFVYAEKGFEISPLASTQCNWFDVQFIDFARCQIAILLNATHYIVGGNFSNITINFTESADDSHWGIKAQYSGSYSCQDLHFDNINLRRLGAGTNINGIDFSNCALLDSTIRIANLTAGIINKLKKTTDAQNPLCYYSEPMTKVIRSLNTEATTRTFTIFTNSPFVTAPQIIVTDTKGLITDYTVSNTNGGDLKVTITMSEAVQDYFFITIPNNSYKQTSSSDA